jgi:hypothetical protein
MQKTLILTLFLILCLSCAKDSEIRNFQAEIITMTFDFGEVVFNETTGVVKAPENTDLGNLTPVIEISKGATISPLPEEATDYSEIVVFTVISEDRNNSTDYEISVLLPDMKIIVWDCSGCSYENPYPVNASGALISLFIEEDNEIIPYKELETNDNGEAWFYGNRNRFYYISVIKGKARSTKNGYLIQGVAQTPEDVDYYSIYMPELQIGDLIYVDWNGDARLDENDESDYHIIQIDNRVPDGDMLITEIFISE